MVLLCPLLVHHRLHIDFSKSLLCLTQCFQFLELFWDTVDMSGSVPSWTNFLRYRGWFILLLQRQSVTVHQVKSFWDKTTFCSKGHALLCQLCCVILSYMLNVYHSPVHLILVLNFLFCHGISFRDCLSCSIVQSLCDIFFLVSVYYQCYTHLLGYLFSGF